MTKKIMIPVLALAVTGAVFLGTNQLVNAQSNGSTSLVQMIAQKFGLNQSQVQSVFDQYKNQRQSNRQQRLLDKLNLDVSQGKITASQKQAILDEIAKLKSEYNFQSLKNMTPDQRRQTFQNKQAEVSAWAKAQGIDPSYLIPGFGRHMGWFKSNPTVTPTQ